MNSLSEKQVKGAMLERYYHFVEKKWGKHGLEEFVDAIGRDPDNLKGSSWYDVSIAVEMLQWIEAKGGMSAVETLGGFTITDTPVLPTMLKMMTVKSLFPRAVTQGYKFSYNFGTPSVEYVDDKHCIVEITDFAESKLLCHTWIGSLQILLNLKKLRGEVKEESCQLDGAPCCRFAIRWE